MSRKREFGIKYSFKKIFFTNWQKQKTKIIPMEGPCIQLL
jgi:hypothetical protein